jgi:hypothetical protein
MRWWKRTKERIMRTSNQELTLRGALSDPLIRILMAADKVDPVQLERMLTGIAHHAAPHVSSALGNICGCTA